MISRWSGFDAVGWLVCTRRQHEGPGCEDCPQHHDGYGIRADNPDVDTLFERLIAWSLRSAATAMLIAGVAMLVAGMPAWPMTAGSETPRAIVVILMQMGGVLVVGAVASKYFLRRRAPMLPNERITVAEDQRPSLDGLLIVLAVTLIAAPLLLVVQLRPFLAEWRFVWGYIADPELWDNANANMSGVVLIPLAGALTPPFLQLLALAGFVAASATLMPLLVARSPRFPRIYIVSLVLLSTVLLASIRATSGVMLARDALRQEIARTSVNAPEEDTLQNGLDRYTNAMRTAAPPLAWTWLAYAVWIPLLLRSGRVSTTFGNRVAIARPEKAADLETITRPPQAPGIGF